MADPVTRLNAALEGRYRIERQLGEGGMATVYLADDLKHERKVALKVLKPELAAVVGAERFLAEIRTRCRRSRAKHGSLHPFCFRRSHGVTRLATRLDSVLAIRTRKRGVDGT